MRFIKVWAIYNEEIEVVSFVTEFVSNLKKLSRNEIEVVSFISGSYSNEKWV
jgi:hypothetical protein